MRKLDGKILFAAHDLDRFLACPNSTFLDLRDLEEPLPRSEDDDQLRLLKEKGVEHERAWLERLRGQGLSIVEISSEAGLRERVEETRRAMDSGADIIYQAALLGGDWHGYADFLRRRRDSPGSDRPLYEVIDTKLARTAAAHHIIQLCVYTDLLAGYQGSAPPAMYLVLGDNREVAFRFLDFVHYFRVARRRLEAFVVDPPKDSYPEPCGACERCRWRDICAAKWEADDHLSLVANIRRSQIENLRAAGVSTVRALAQSGVSVAKLSSETLSRLRSQAQLQVYKRDTGENRFELLSAQEGRGFARLPRPDPGDLFLDFEGDPLYPDGLEYLMGIYFSDSGRPVFKPFWGHNHDGERAAFEQLIDFIDDRLRLHPGAHVYHYNHYEETAIKRLASGYGTRESAVDNLLRGRRLVDLYKLVREAVRVSEPSYSLKNLEVFYMEGRGEEVKTAGQSIVVYENWRSTRDPVLLQQIAEYNEADCRSTALLRDWLITLRPAKTPWFEIAAEEPDEQKIQVRTEAESRRSICELRLLQSAPEVELPVRRLTGHLLEFHRREAKPEWWKMFDRQSRSEEELIDDAECLGGLRLYHAVPPFAVARSTVLTYRFPPQDYKFAVGDNCLTAETLEPAGSIYQLEPESGTVQVKRATNRGVLPERLSVVPTGPIDSRTLRDAVYRFADSLASGDGRYRAVQSLLFRELPAIDGREPGSPIARDPENILKETIQAVADMRDSCLFIQGPPGSGKTFTSSHVIVELMSSGHRVGVASNSHKAINNLLATVEEVSGADKSGRLSFRGIKKSNGQNPDTFFNGKLVVDVTSNDDVDRTADLIAGTAWLFARPEFDQALDYLFVDEAGQVSLANIVAMGLSARNIVLVGDQMQLAQPIQGVHPGESGLSALEYLLQGAATIAPERGIFLPTTWRMHGDVCRFISEAVYDGRLHPETGNQNRRLVLAESAHPALKPSGIRFVPVEHSGCSQKSEEEGRVILEMYQSLLCQHYRDREGKEHQFHADNILIVTPYNVQVNYLKSVLPPEARVGTVDKFQGQEAEVVLISMVTSSGEDLPRDIEFLYSKNRLNVAISRARCLAVIVASPRLLEIHCRTVEEMRLVNTLCHASHFGTGAS